MSNFLLVTVPFCTLDHRYFAAAYLAGIVRKAGWDYKFLDLNILVYNACSSGDSLKSLWNVSNQVKLYEDTKSVGRNIIYDSLKKEIQDSKPDLIGFSLMSSNRLYGQLALEVLADLKVEIPVIYGGPDCFPREYYKEYFRVPFFPDIMLKGEAEIALPEFLREFELSCSVQTNVEGFVYKNDSGDLIDTGMPVIPYLRDDNLPADYSVFDYLDPNYELDNTIFTFCSKGCINKCAFCSESRNYQPYRRRQAQEVIDDIICNLERIPAKYKGRSEVVFRDSIFNASPKYVKEICDLLIKHDLNIKWFCLGGFRVVLSDDIFQLMRQSGCKRIFFGFESGSQRVADLMGKNFNIFVAQQTIDQCLKHDISVTLPVINGFPGEFTRDFITSMAFILRYRDKVDFGYSNTCGIFKKTPLSSHPEDFLIEKVEEVNYELRDGYNIFPVRQLRQVVNGALCRHDKIEDNEALFTLDFNIPPVAAELARIIYYLSVFLGRKVDKKLFRELAVSSQEKNGNCCGHDEYLRHVIPGIPLVEWLEIDKEEKVVRGKIVSKLAELVGDFERKILAENNVNFYDFRNSLYDFSHLRLKGHPLPKLLNLHERFSEYDKGGHLIFKGGVARNKAGADVCVVEARCGDYAFDIHCWAGDTYKVDGVLSIWGKVSAKMVRANPIEMKIIYSDGEIVFFEFPLAAVETVCPNKNKGVFCYFRRTLSKLF